MSDCPSDDLIQAVILQIATERAPKSLCPSEVARALSDEWRGLMPSVRRVASGLEQIAVTQKGAPVDAMTARGPVRLALRDTG